MKVTFPMTSEANANLYGSPDQRAGRAQQLLPSDEELAEIQKAREEEERRKEEEKKKSKKPGAKKEDEDADDSDDSDPDEETDDEDSEDEDGEETEDSDEESEEEGEVEEEAEASTQSVASSRRIPRGEEAEAADEVIKIVSGFPGIGKSTLYNRDPSRTADSDSSKFDKANFPANYLEHIQSMVDSDEVDRILVSSHKDVRDALVANDLPFYLVYPHPSLKEEYLQRYSDRGSPAQFVNMMRDKWDEFIAQCESQEGCEKIVLNSGEYLADVL